MNLPPLDRQPQAVNESFGPYPAGAATVRPVGARVAMVLALVAGVLGWGLATPLATGPAAAADPEPPRLYVVSDSVVLGAREAITARFGDYQVTVDGVPAIFTEVAAQLAWERRDLIGDVAIVATGYNYPYWDPARFDRSIDTMVQRLTEAGATRIIWVTLRERIVAPNNATTRAQIRRYAWYFPRVNEHLVRALERHPTLELADWAAISGERGLTYDAIHLTARGAGVMADLLRRTVDAGFGRTPAGATVRLRLVPEGTAAVAGPAAVWLEALGPVRDGQVVLDDCAAGPATMVSLGRNRTRRGLVIVTTAGGEVCATPTAAVTLSATMAGPAPSPPAPAPVELGSAVVGAGATATFSAAPGAGTRLVDVAVSAGAGAGPVTVWPCATARPGVAQLTATAGQVVSTMVALDAAGDVCVWSAVGAFVKVVEVARSGAPALAPARLADTRSAVPVAARAEVADIGPLPSVVHLTVIGGAGPATVTVGPCDGLTTTMAIEPGTVTSRSLVMSGRLCAAADAPVHLVVDRDGPWPG